MKKKIILVSVLLLLATNVFSKGIYNGNFQITGGYNVNQLSTTKDAEPFIKMNTVNFGLETWHLFKLPLLLEVGFMFDMDLGFGQTDIITTDNNFTMNAYGLFGPAIAINVLNIVKANLGIGPAFDFTLSQVDETSLLSYAIGFALNLQAILFPISPVSPIIGYKFAVQNGSLIFGLDKNTGDVINSEITSFKNEVYLGISFNW